jgi:hypothetical protein
MALTPRFWKQDSTRQHLWSDGRLHFARIDVQIASSFGTCHPSQDCLIRQNVFGWVVSD